MNTRFHRCLNADRIAVTILLLAGITVGPADSAPLPLIPNPVGSGSRLELISPTPRAEYSHLPTMVFRVSSPADLKLVVRIALKDPRGNQSLTILTAAEAAIETKERDASDLTPAKLAPENERRFSLDSLVFRPVDGQYALSLELLDPQGKVVATAESTFRYHRRVVDRSKRWAIIVAVSKYKNVLTKELPSSYSDAAKLYRALAPSYGHITVITDSPTPELPTAVVKAGLSSELQETLEQELTKAHQAKAEYLFFAFTGHGMNVNGESYLLPAQFNDDETAGMLSVNQTLRKLTSKGLGGGEPIPHVLMLLDASQNAFGSKLRLDTIRPPARARPDQTIHILASCQPGQVSLTLNNAAPGADRGSLFVNAFATLLRQGIFEDWLSFGDALTRQVRAASSTIVQMNPALENKLSKDYAQEPQIQSYPQSPEVFRNFREFFEPPALGR